MKKNAFLKDLSIKLIVSIILISSILFAANFKIFAEETRQYKNEAPIIMVHGFAGYGRDESKKSQYWGQKAGDLQNIMKDKHNINIMTASVGPLSSNWHRACELYAYIKGGRVDYGKYKSEKLGHNRYGREFPGLYPNWSSQNKIHLVGHSQGGQTIRLLAQLLEFGYQDEIDATDPNDLSPLFSGNLKNHIISITTIATPHDGTTQMNFVESIINKKTHTLFSFLNLINASTSIPFMDYQLEYWGLYQQKDESFKDFYKRTKDNPAWRCREAFASYDLTSEGATELNKWVMESENIKYLSYSTQITHEKKILGRTVYRVDPRITDPFMCITARMIASTNITKDANINKLYRHNDGVVNTYSAYGPKLGRDSNNIKETYYESSIENGIWYHLATLNNLDHNQVCGKDSYGTFDTINFYKQHFELLISLE